MAEVIAYLETKEIPFEVLEHERAVTALEEAATLHLDPHVVVKTVLVDTRWGRVLAVIPGDRRIDMQMLRDAVGDHFAHLASEVELTGVCPRLELGTLPPLGRLLELPTFVDGDVMRHECVVFPARIADRGRSRAEPRHLRSRARDDHAADARPRRLSGAPGLSPR